MLLVCVAPLLSRHIATTISPALEEGITIGALPLVSAATGIAEGDPAATEIQLAPPGSFSVKLAGTATFKL
jgi:hypothetical protein